MENADKQRKEQQQKTESGRKEKLRIESQYAMLAVKSKTRERRGREMKSIQTCEEQLEAAKASALPSTAKGKGKGKPKKGIWTGSVIFEMAAEHFVEIEVLDITNEKVVSVLERDLSKPMIYKSSDEIIAELWSENVQSEFREFMRLYTGSSMQNKHQRGAGR